MVRFFPPIRNQRLLFYYYYIPTHDVVGTNSCIRKVCMTSGFISFPVRGLSHLETAWRLAILGFCAAGSACGPNSTGFMPLIAKVSFDSSLPKADELELAHPGIQGPGGRGGGLEPPSQHPLSLEWMLTLRNIVKSRVKQGLRCAGSLCGIEGQEGPHDPHEGNPVGARAVDR